MKFKRDWSVLETILLTIVGLVFIYGIWIYMTGMKFGSF